LADIEDINKDELECSNGPLFVLTCPWHEYKFDVNTGKGINQSLEADVWNVHVNDDHVWLDISETETIKNIRFFQLPPSGKNSNHRKFNQNFDALSLTNQNDVNCILEESEMSLCDWAVRILNTPLADEKVKLTFKVSEMWKDGKIKTILRTSTFNVPDRPLRSESLIFVDPLKTKRWKSGGSETGRITILHSLANVEQWAIDLAWDIIARFGDTKISSISSNHIENIKDDSGLDICHFSDPGGYMPRAFFDDFVRVATEEATHYTYLVEQLKVYGSYFGEFPIHDGLWESATTTSHDLLARLAIVHMVHEARGLDVNPKTIEKFRINNDFESTRKLEIIHRDEIGLNY
jgi:uncharacterized ferritin-like protein (DUF455 family)